MFDAEPRTESPAFYASPFATLIAALVFLYLGFSFFGGTWEGPEADVQTIALLCWVTRIGGVGLLIVAGLSAARLPASIVLDMVVSAFAALGCLVGGGLLAYLGYPSGFLMLLLGLMSGHSAWSAVSRWRVRQVQQAAQQDASSPEL